MVAKPVRRPTKKPISFEQRARDILKEVWAELEAIEIEKLPSGSISQHAFEIFEHKEVGWKFSIIVQVLGKAADYSLDTLCLQKGDGTAVGLWEPREFAKRIVVPWNKSIGGPLGESGDPYVNNIFRGPCFDDAMRKRRRSPDLFDKVKVVLETVQGAGSEVEVREQLKLILAQLRRYLKGKTFEYPLPLRVSLQDTLCGISEYLKVSSGGARLQAVAHGLFKALQAYGIPYEQVLSRHVNAADSASDTSGDVECLKAGSSMLTVEVKDRILTLSEVESSVIKARLRNVRELLFFVYGKTDRMVDTPDMGRIQDLIQNEFTGGLNIYIESAAHLMRIACTLLGEEGRKDFLQDVGEALGEQAADPQHRWAWSQVVRAM